MFRSSMMRQSRWSGLRCQLVHWGLVGPAESSSCPPSTSEALVQSELLQSEKIHFSYWTNFICSSVVQSPVCHCDPPFPHRLPHDGLGQPDFKGLQGCDITAECPLSSALNSEYHFTDFIQTKSMHTRQHLVQGLMPAPQETRMV